MIDARLRLPKDGFTLDLALQLPGTGVTALFGPSGCGKTTVLRALAGLERAMGRIAVGDAVWQDDEQRVFLPPHRRQVGYVIQEATLFPHLNVRHNLEYGWRRVAPAARRVSLDQVVDLLGIGALMARRPDNLSGGERQRVVMARALATSPRLLLMDEPLSALDATRKAEVLPYLERLHAELRIPVVYVSHAIDEVARLAHHLVLMEAGQVRAHGPLAEVMSRLDTPAARGDGAGVVHDAIVAERDPTWHLARLQLGDPQAGVSLWARDQGLPVGRGVRVRIQARDVSLAREPQHGTSIGNQLPAVVEALADDEHPALALVRVRAGSPSAPEPLHLPILARLTRRSAHALGLAQGQRVWAQVKSVALME